MKKKLMGFAAMAAALTFVGTANAATYLTKLEHKDADGVADGLYGYVKIEEEDSKNLLVTVTLEAPLTLIIDSGKHNAFTFNVVDGAGAKATGITQAIVEPVGGGSYVPSSETPDYSNPPFGNDKWFNAWQCCGNGSSNGQPPPLVFRITSVNDITFAGVGATFNDQGKLLTTGSGYRMGSTSGGWWFATDVSDGRDTGAVAARDAFLVTTVPEPGAWALMIAGFGGVGAMFRRRKTAFA